MRRRRKQGTPEATLAPIGSITVHAKTGDGMTVFMSQGVLEAHVKVTGRTLSDLGWEAEESTSEILANSLEALVRQIREEAF